MDSCSKAVIEKTQSIETERLLVACRIKECDHRIGLQKQSKEKLTETLHKKEKEKKDVTQLLDKLSATQDQLKQQLLTQADNLRKCEVEEDLLLKDANQQLVHEETELQACQMKMSELLALRATFATPAVVVTMRSEIEALHARRDAINEEHEALLHQICVTESAIQATSMPLSTCPVPNSREPHASAISFTATDDSAEAEELHLLRAQVGQKKLELERLTASSRTSRSSAVQREVADLTKRSAELCLWREQAEGSLAHLHSRQACLATAMEQHLCFQCFQVAGP